MLAIRERLRASHHGFLRAHAGTIRRAGALCSAADAPPSGALWLLDVSSREQAISLIERDPYFHPQYRKYRLFEWKWALDYPVGDEARWGREDP
jgi:uncharacterized protein YciI